MNAPLVKLGMTKQLGATLDQRGAITTELGDVGVADALVWTGRDAAGNYSRNVILPLAPFAQMAFNSEATADTSTNATNASISVSVEALNKSFTLPPGTWTVRIVVSMTATHTTGGRVFCQPALDGTALGSHGANVDSLAPGRISNSGTFTGVAAGAHVAAANFRPNTAGTAATANPQILVDAWRTA